jgi:hypothetical protein
MAFLNEAADPRLSTVRKFAAAVSCMVKSLFLRVSMETRVEIGSDSGVFLYFNASRKLDRLEVNYIEDDHLVSATIRADAMPEDVRELFTKRFGRGVLKQ